MARGKKKTNGKAPAEPTENGIGHNSNGAPPELTDEQRQALFFAHKRKYESALAKKKETDAAFKNTCKLAKAELGDDAVASIKDTLLLETDEGEADLRAGIERQMRVARWMNVPFGQQADLFNDFTDPRPATERAHAEGKRAGMEGLPCVAPYDPSVPQRDEWIAGWQEGQAAIFAIQRSEDAAIFDEVSNGAEA